MPNFNEIADKHVGDIERPPLMPHGNYIFTVAKVPTHDSIAEGAWEVVDFPLKCIQACDDVDPDAIEEFGDVSGAFQRLRFMFDTQDNARFKRSEFQLRRFLEEHLQIDGVEDMSVREALAASVNHQCMGEVSWRPDKNDPEIQYAEIRRTGPVV